MAIDKVPKHFRKVVTIDIAATLVRATSLETSCAQCSSVLKPTTRLAAKGFGIRDLESRSSFLLYAFPLYRETKFRRLF